MRYRTQRAAVLGLTTLLLGSAAWGTPIDIPLNTWVRRPLPPNDEGPCPSGCKHMRLAHNPGDGRIYFEGGDYNGTGHIDSGRQETWSYSIADGTWRLEYPYCGPAGGVQPMHPDEVGWAYDTRRNLFWLMPGYMGGDTGDCSGGASQIRYEIMTFNPASGQWILENRQELTTSGGHHTFAQYDPVTDTIIQFDGCGVAIYDIATDTWTTKVLPGCPTLSNEHSAIDRIDRVIYGIERGGGKFWRYHIDTQTVEALAPAPAGSMARARPVWDSVNRVLLWFDYTADYDPVGGRLNIYHPDTNTWEVNRPVYQPEGDEVVGLNVVFDPYQNVLLVMGSRSVVTGYFHLYRYGNGSGAPADSVAPSAPANLHTR